ncbi:MAG: sulfite exporter TauE/SafE family protein [Patescibacteria group bacterium]
MAFSFLIFLAFALIAEVIATVAGFGSSTLLVPVATFFFDIKTAIALVGLFHFTGSLVDGIIWRKHINWRIGILFSLLGVLTSFLGAYLVSYLPSQTVLQLLGIFLVVYSLFELLGRGVRLPHSDLAVVGAGGLVGFLAGLVGTSGALRTAFLSTFKLKKENFLGTSFAIAFAVDLTRVATYLGSGILKLNLGVWAAIFAVAVVGSLIGKKLVFKLPEKIFYKIIYSALFLAGLRFIFS